MAPVASAAGPPPRHPDAPEAAVRGGVEGGHLPEGGGVVAEDPAVAREGVAVRAEGDVHNTLGEQKRRAVELPERVEPDVSIGIRADAARQCRDHHWPAELLGAGGDVEGVEPVHVARPVGRDLFGQGLDVERAGCGVDHRRRGDPDLGREVVRAHIAGRDGCHDDPGGRVGEKADLPERIGIGTRGVVRVEGVHAVVLGGDEHHLAGALPRDAHP